MSGTSMGMSRDARTRTYHVVAGVGVGPGAPDGDDRLLEVRIRPPFMLLGVVSVGGLGGGVV